MEKISFALFILSIVGYVTSENFLGHLWALIFFNSSVLVLLSNLIIEKTHNLSEQEVFFVYVVLSIYLFGGIFATRHKLKNSNIDEIKK